MTRGLNACLPTATARKQVWHTRDRQYKLYVDVAKRLKSRKGTKRISNKK